MYSCLLVCEKYYLLGFDYFTPSTSFEILFILVLLRCFVWFIHTQLHDKEDVCLFRFPCLL